MSNTSGAHFDKEALYSVIRNTSGKTRRFGFLPPHGVQLDDQQEYTVFGNVLEAVFRAERATDRRNAQALAAALDRGDIEIMHTPAPILKDTVTGLNKMIKLSSGSLSAVAPSWENSDSLDVDIPA